MFQNGLGDFFSNGLNMSAANFIWGIIGALCRTLKKTDGRIQTRLLGFILAIATVTVIEPLILDLLKWHYHTEFPSTVTNAISFTFGLLAQTGTESFIDNPPKAVIAWIVGFKRFKKSLFNGDVFKTDEPNKNDDDNSNKGA